MNVWDSDGAVLSFPPPDTEDGVMFHIVENDLMVHSLSQQLSRFDNVEISYGKGVKSVSDQGDQGVTHVVLTNKEGKYSSTTVFLFYRIRKNLFEFIF